MAKGEKTGGRQKGSKNKVTIEREKAVAEYTSGREGLQPLDIMLENMRFAHEKGGEVLGKILEGDGANMDSLKELIRFRQIAQDCANQAAPYVHPKLAAIEHTGKDGKDLIPDAQPHDVAKAILDIMREAKVGS